MLVLLAGSLPALTGAEPLERGIIYVQPSYHYTSTLLLDMAVLRRDLDSIAQHGFVNVGLRTSWGEIMSKWDHRTHQPTWNEASCQRLAIIAAECAKRKLRLIFNTHLKDTVPEGVEGAVLVNHTEPDSQGVVPAPYWRSTFVDHMVRSVLFSCHQMVVLCRFVIATEHLWWPSTANLQAVSGSAPKSRGSGNMPSRVRMSFLST